MLRLAHEDSRTVVGLSVDYCRPETFGDKVAPTNLLEVAENRLLGAVDIQLLHAIRQRAGLHREESGGAAFAGDLPVALNERVHNVSALHFTKRSHGDDFVVRSAVRRRAVRR